MTATRDTNISMSRRWLIISWQHDDLMGAAYGQCIASVEGTYEDACAEARNYIINCGPVGVVGVIE